MTKTFTLKPGQQEKSDINKVEVNSQETKEVVEDTVITLEQIDQEIANLQERADKLLAEKTVKMVERSKINIEAKKATLAKGK